MLFGVLFMNLGSLFGQYDGNTSPTYPELVEIYKQLDKEHEEIELYNMGESDYGLPIYLCVINGVGDSTGTFMKAIQGTTLLINNAIHPGEPDGVNACLIWINNWIKAGKPRDIPLIGIIPAYNVGGMMNRSSSSRANQNGPEEYGFRGNAKNLDLNRDFVKMDSKNMFTFANIYQALDPDVFIDTHVSNGADYQYYMTYIASVRERMAPSLGDLMHDSLIPFLEENFEDELFPIVPYVDMKGKTPDEGIRVFNDLPRYAMGYATMMNAISFTTETHMLKPFRERVKHTQYFIQKTVEWMENHSRDIEKARFEAFMWEDALYDYDYNFQLTDEFDSIVFHGYEFSYPESDVTGTKRLRYHRESPYSKKICFYNKCYAVNTIQIPKYIVLGGQCSDVIQRLDANDISYYTLPEDSLMDALSLRIMSFNNGDKPYEGHFLHNKIAYTTDSVAFKIKPGDIMIPLDQANKRLIMSLFVPDAPDSYFAWNFFDSYVQQKEYFSPYVFEDYAKEMLKKDKALQKEFEKKKKDDSAFNESSFDQLYFLYKRSEFYEPTHNLLPYAFIYH